MDQIKVETLAEAEVNWEPCFEMKNEEDIPIEYVQLEELHWKSPEKRRTVIVPKSELGSEYDYIRDAEITICESTIEVDVSIEAECEICETTLSQPSHQRSVELQAKMCNKCSAKYLPKVVLQKRRLEKKHRGTTRAKPFKCDKCPKTFNFKGGLNTHKLIHTGEKPYKCEQCTKKFRSQANLYNHRTVHSVVKPFECYKCPYKCHRLPTLRRHMLIHTGEMPHQCDQCQRKFRNGSHLKRHMRIHATDKPYECKICSYKCHNNGILTTHLIRIHGEKRFECKECSYKCISKGSLTKHLNIHREKQFERKVSVRDRKAHIYSSKPENIHTNLTNDHKNSELIAILENTNAINI